MSQHVDPRFRRVVLPSAPLGMDFSNDGSLLACATNTNAEGAAVVHVVRTQDGNIEHGFIYMGIQSARGVAFVGARDLIFLYRRETGITQLMRAAVDSRDPHELKSYGPAANNEGLTRDRTGKRFAVLGKQLEIWDATTNQLLHTLDGAPGSSDPIRAAFSPDGNHIYVYGTVVSTVVRYDVTSGKEDARWAAPSPRGAQVLVTPDARFLIASADQHRGLFAYDLTTNQQLTPSGDSDLTFDEDSQWRPWAMSHDSRLLICLKASLQCVRLPDLVDVSPPDEIVEPRNRSWIAASAWDAPLIAFGTAADATVRWFELK